MGTSPGSSRGAAAPHEDQEIRRNTRFRTAFPSFFLWLLPLSFALQVAAIGILLTLIGAYIGERIQLGPPPKTAE